MKILHCHPIVRTPIFFICILILIVVIPIAAVVIAVISIYVIIRDMIAGVPHHNQEIEPPWIKYEIKMFPEIKEKKVIYNQRHFDVPIRGSDDLRLVELFYLSKSEYNPKWPTFVCMHGTMGFSTNYIEMMYQMPPESNCYFIDMVGFGKSKCINSTGMVMPRDYLDLEIQTIRKFMEYIDLEDAHFIGHSFGSYLATEYAACYPSTVRSLTLISPAGLFPTLGVYARYYGMIYQSRFPYSVCNKLASISPRIAKELLSIFVDNNKASHWIATYGDNSCFGGELVASLIEVNKEGGFCKSYTFTKLLRLLCPIHFIYGETDDITPSHQGELFCKISPENSTIKIYKGLWHAPLSKYAIFMREHLAELAAIAHPNKEKNLDYLHSYKNALADYYEACLDMPSYISTYDVAKTKNTIEKLYNHILYLHNYFTQSVTLLWGQASAAPAAVDASVAVKTPAASATAAVEAPAISKKTADLSASPEIISLQSIPSSHEN